MKYHIIVHVSQVNGELSRIDAVLCKGRELVYTLNQELTPIDSEEGPGDTITVTKPDGGEVQVNAPEVPIGGILAFDKEEYYIGDRNVRNWLHKVKKAVKGHTVPIIALCDYPELDYFLDKIIAVDALEMIPRGICDMTNFCKTYLLMTGQFQTELNPIDTVLGTLGVAPMSRWQQGPGVLLWELQQVYCALRTYIIAGEQSEEHI